jgi:hypothetical protein
LKFIKKENPVPVGQGWILIVLATFCFLSPLVNPYGLELPRTWIAIMESPVISASIEEHRPLLSFDFWWLTLPTILLYFSFLLGTFYRLPRITWIVPLIWLILSFFRVRHMALFALTVPFAIAEMYPHIRWIHWLDKKGSVFFSLRRKTKEGIKSFLIFLAIPLSLTITSIVCQTKELKIPIIGKNWAKVDPEHWPVDLLSELRKIEKSSPQGTPIFNTDNFGGFLIFFTPGFRVFIDDRFELYSNEFIKNYMASGPKFPMHLKSWEEKYNFNYALVKAGSHIDKVLTQSPSWHLIKKSKSGCLYGKSLN